MSTTHVDHPHIDDGHVRRTTTHVNNCPVLSTSPSSLRGAERKFCATYTHLPSSLLLLRDAEHMFDPRRPLFGTHHNPGPSALIRDAFPPSPLSLCRIYKVNVL